MVSTNPEVQIEPGPELLAKRREQDWVRDWSRFHGPAL
jgi:hypothetical protein